MASETDHKKKSAEDKTAFIIAMIGVVNSRERRRIDGLIDLLIDPVLKEFDLSAVASHRIDESGSITDQIINRLLNAKLVVCDLTYNNPNVMYELAIRHAAQLPVVLIAEEETKIPFDIGDQRTTFFKPDYSGLVEFRPMLKDKIEAVLKQQKLDNPVSRVVRERLFKESAAGKGDNLGFLAEQISDVRAMMSKLMTSLGQKHGPGLELFGVTPAARISRAGSLLKRFEAQLDQKIEIQLIIFGPERDALELLRELTSPLIRERSMKYIGREKFVISCYIDWTTPPSVFITDVLMPSIVKYKSLKVTIAEEASDEIA